MEEDPDILAIAQALVERFGTAAARVAEERAKTHRCAEETEGAELWQGVADAVRMLLTARARRPLRGPS